MEKAPGKYLLACQGNQVILGGDGRCDSPGYCAKYGSYSCMDMDTNKILDIQLVQVRNVMIFYKSEKEIQGFQNLCAQLHHVAQNIWVKKYMCGQNPEIMHYFDVWHVAKGEMMTKKGLVTKYVTLFSYFCFLQTFGDFEPNMHTQLTKKAINLHPFRHQEKDCGSW